MFSVIRNTSLGIIVGLGLIACGDDKAASSTNVTAAAPNDSVTTPVDSVDDIFSSLNIEKVDGVTYQDEIYANWPYN
ncbi:MAG: hypothetical protein CMF45_05510 [Legionellales bacterium]|nr:hypothetical protein [Legionellales bacterium]|tara:strand:- start:968 stop:1198 length:231 start_codon:yes stop_codon:yes gene_type:complete